MWRLKIINFVSHVNESMSRYIICTNRHGNPCVTVYSGELLELSVAIPPLPYNQYSWYYGEDHMMTT